MKKASLSEFKQFCDNNTVHGFMFEANQQEALKEPIWFGCRFTQIKIHEGSNRVVFYNDHAFLDIASIVYIVIGDIVEDYYRKMSVVCDDYAHEGLKTYELMMTF